MNAAIKLPSLPRARAALRLVTTDTPRDTADRVLLHQRVFDRGALVTFLERYREQSTAYFRRRGVSSPADHDDLLQELALAVLESHMFFDASAPQPPARWLAGIRSRVLGAWKRAERYRGAIVEGLQRQPRETTVQPTSGEAPRVRQAVRGLSPVAQEIVRRYVNDESVRETAAAMGLSPATVHEELQAARGALKVSLGARLFAQLTKPIK